jgi:hypothetical protein
MRLPRDAGRFVRQTQQNMPLILLGALFLAGAFCGSGLYRTMGEKTANTLILLLSGTGEAQSFRFGSVFRTVFFTNLGLCALLFLCGFCAISQPVILLVPFVKGLGFGLVAAANTVLLSPFSAFFWLKFLPGAFLSAAFILVCARQSLELSCYVYQSVFSAKPPERHALPAAYGGKYLGLAAACMGISLLDVLFDWVYELVSAAAGG